jgi:hypothetical protein
MLLASLAAHADFSSLAENISVSALKAAHYGGTFFPVAPSEAVSVMFVKLGNDPWQIGMLQKMRVNAPLKQLLAVLDDVPGYVGIFDDLVKAEKREIKSADDYLLFTETSIPLPFVPNDKTSMRYRVEHYPAATSFRFGLTEGNHLRAFEGFALAVADGPLSSVYWEFDLIEPAFGFSRSLPVKKFWVQNAEGSAQSDWALKLKAEGGKKSAEILAESKRRSEILVDSFAAAYDAPVSFETLLAQATPANPSSKASAKKPLAPPASTAKPNASGPKSEPKP